jgi:hypothetical protein
MSSLYSFTVMKLDYTNKYMYIFNFFFFFSLNKPLQLRLYATILFDSFSFVVNSSNNKGHILFTYKPTDIYLPFLLYRFLFIYVPMYLFFDHNRN